MKVKPIIFIVLASSMSIALFGCGDLKATRDILQERNREQIAQRKSELQPLVGQYEGSLLDARSDRRTRFRLNIVMSGAPYEGAGIPEDTITPTVAASAIYSMDKNGNNYVTVEFSNSDYNAKTGELNLFSDIKGSTLQMNVVNRMTKDMTESVETLTGTWFNNNRGTIGTFDVSRIK